MIIKISVLVLLAAAALAVPVHAVATNNPVNFDGTRARPEKDPVRAGSINDLRTPEQIANDEQFKANARVERTETTSAPKFNLTTSEPAPSANKRDRLIGGLTGALCGLLGGGMLAFGLSRINLA